MGLTKQYLRYVPAGSFNIIANANCNVAFVVLKFQEGRFVAVGAAEHIIIWDLRIGERAIVLPGETSEVTYIRASPNKQHLAAGYADGIVKIFDLESGELTNTFAGHRSQVTCLAFDQTGLKLASGAKDNDVIVWDIVADAGFCRLSGHKGPVNQLIFMSNHNILLSASKDTFVKFWDLDTKHCFKTLVGHKSEIWGMVLMKNEKYLATGCTDAEIRVWNIGLKDDAPITPEAELFVNDEDPINDDNYPIHVKYIGSILRGGRGRVVTMQSDLSGSILGCHGTDNQLELFLFCTEEEAKNRLKKRQKKARKKMQETPELNEGSTNVEELPLSLKDEIRRLSTIKLSQKPKSLDLILGVGGEFRVAVGLAKNVVELYSLTTEAHCEPKCLRSLMHHGHHSEIRAVNFSYDGLVMVTGSGDSVKIWNKSSQICLRTIETGYVVTLCFSPIDRYVLAGLKDGSLVIIDISVGEVIETIPAHKQELWSICITPNKRGCVTGGGDNTVKFWDFESVIDEKNGSNSKVLSLLHTRTLKLEENVLCVKLSPNGKYIAVALLDSTVKLFFVDTFKFYLSLYGHKLPVLCMDISSDSTLIATGSADRNVKIWGLDFGDCHKSLFAHDDSITGLQFVPNTHQFFTCSRDGKVKQWDADSYDKILTLSGHIGETWALAISPIGKHVLTSGSDQVLRLWERSEEILVLEDNLENELETMEELATGEDTIVPGKGLVVLPTKKTIGSEKAAELILECLEVNSAYNVLLNEHKIEVENSSRQIPLPPLPPLMQAYEVKTSDEFVLETFKRIRSSDLEEALLLLPFTSVCDLLQYLPRLAAQGDNIELIAKVITFLLRIHSKPLQASTNMLATLKLLELNIQTKSKQLMDMIGFNFYGLQFLQREIEISEGVQMFRSATLELNQSQKKRKQREKRKRALITLSV